MLKLALFGLACLAHLQVTTVGVVCWWPLRGLGRQGEVGWPGPGQVWAPEGDKRALFSCCVLVSSARWAVWAGPGPRGESWLVPKGPGQVARGFRSGSLAPGDTVRREFWAPELGTRARGKVFKADLAVNLIFF